MKLATTTGDFFRYTKTDAEAVAAFEGTGFRYLDYSFYNAARPGSVMLTDGWIREVERAAETAARLGFEFVQAHAPSYNPLEPGVDHENGLRALLRSIEACGRLGVRNIVLHAAFGEEYTYPEGREGFFRANRRFCESLFPTMEKYGVSVCMENSAEKNMGGRYFFMTGGEIADFVEWVGHPLLQGCMDVGHANMRDESVYKTLRELGPHLKALHIQDNFGVFDEHTAPFFGTLDLDGVMQALLDVGYDGYFTFEADNMLMTSGWPHPKKLSPEVTRRRLLMPPLELRRHAEGLLYHIGRYILEQYGCFEE